MNCRIGKIYVPSKYEEFWRGMDLFVKMDLEIILKRIL